MQSDRETVTQLVKKLKEEIKHVNAFVILFNGQVDSILVGLYVCLVFLFVFVVILQEPRFTNSLKSMILLFEDILGPGFWPNVIFAVSRFSITSKHHVGQLGPRVRHVTFFHDRGQLKISQEGWSVCYVLSSPFLHQKNIYSPKMYLTPYLEGVGRAGPR